MACPLKGRGPWTPGRRCRVRHPRPAKPLHRNCRRRAALRSGSAGWIYSRWGRRRVYPPPRIAAVRVAKPGCGSRRCRARRSPAWKAHTLRSRQNDTQRSRPKRFGDMFGKVVELGILPGSGDVRHMHDQRIKARTVLRGVNLGHRGIVERVLHRARRPFRSATRQARRPGSNAAASAIEASVMERTRAMTRT